MCVGGGGFPGVTLSPALSVVLKPIPRPPQRVTAPKHQVCVTPADPPLGPDVVTSGD